MRTDEALMQAYVQGDTGAFKEIFERHAPALLALMRRELYTPEEARDLVQQAFLHLHRARLDYDPSQPFKPWLVTIALNLKREYFRRSRRRPEDPFDPTTLPEPPSRPGPALAVDARRTLDWALAQLPESYRLPIELHWFWGMSFAEAAQALGISQGAAKIQAHRGYQELRRLLTEATNGPNPVTDSTPGRTRGER